MSAPTDRPPEDNSHCVPLSLGIDSRWWGKAMVGPGWHPLGAHSLDVTATGLELMNQMPTLRQVMASRLNLSPAQARAWVCFWLSLHDLGKFAESFQAQRDDLFVQLRGRRPHPSKRYDVRHDSLGLLFWKAVLRDLVIGESWFGMHTEDLADGLDAWIRATTGHHGQPPAADGFWADHFDAVEDRAAALAHVAQMRSMFLDAELVEAIARLDPIDFQTASQELSWWMAGLAVLADWVGSNSHFFPYLVSDIDADTSVGAYWLQTQQQAALAIGASGVLPPAASGEMPFDSLFPDLGTASPLQRWAIEVPLADGPQLHCLEDVTGAGKTEAALMLTHRLMASGQASGFFVALPTMATANAMYARVATTYQRLFGQAASLMLATGSRDLVERFTTSVVEDLAAQVLPQDAPELDPSQIDETASARCTAWLADHRKRALLAPAGVGTIDQALLAVLHSKHQSLRLLGLHHKVLVVDEVHACDDYMLHVLAALLQFHARGGGSAVLLSATLPLRARRKLLAAFAQGLGQQAHVADVAAYPLVTSWPSPQAAAGEAKTCAVDTRADVRRHVRVVQHEHIAEVLALVREALARGKCVCWVRNTVADAVDAFDLFSAEWPAERLWLFHARFALHDRLSMEQQVLQAFGKHSGPSERAGRLLIATQVVEQSLDVDFDLMVSDLAPIDRLIQRAGRLRRHRRRADGTPQAEPQTADARGEPVLHLLCPPWTPSPAADWFKATFPKAAAVYPSHAQSWLTMLALRTGGFTMPDDARRLVEGVFGEDAEAPAGLQANAQAAEGRGYAAQSQAQMHTLALQQGYSRTQTHGTDWWSDAHTPSRLGEASSTVALARWDGTHLRPWVDRPEHGWAYSSLRIAERSVTATAEPDDPTLRAAVEAAKLQLPAQGRWTVLLPLQATPQGWIGEALAPETRGRPPRRRAWRYDPQRGLQAWQPAADARAPDDTKEDPEP